MIEANRSPDLGASFGVVAREMRQLALDTNEVSQQIRIHLTAMQALAGRLVKHRTTVTQEAGGEHALLETIVGQIETVAEGIGAVAAAQIQAAGSARHEAAQMHTLLIEAIAGIQFQDIVRQQLGHTSDAIAQLGTHAEAATALVCDPHAGIDLPQVKTMIESVYNSYVMEQQRAAHRRAFGGPEMQDEKPAIELF